MEFQEKQAAAAEEDKLRSTEAPNILRRNCALVIIICTVFLATLISIIVFVQQEPSNHIRM